ncbi:MAG: eCIS core domain-containing protein [Thainema sp.]
MRRRQYAPKPAQDTSVLSSEKLLQTRPFQPEISNNQQAPQLQEEAGALAGSFDLTQRLSSFDPQPISTLSQPLQAKLTIGEPNDKYEQEADRVAHDVVQRIHEADDANNGYHPLGQLGKHADAVRRKAILQRETMLEEEDELQMKPLETLQREVLEEDDELQMKPLVQRKGSKGGLASVEVEKEINCARGGGRSLTPTLQTEMGQAMGADFSGVRVHTDARADQLNRSVGARAFTTGRDLFFKQGEYRPESRGGQELIAHELTHVVQQNKDYKTQNKLIRGGSGNDRLQESLDRPKNIQVTNTTDTNAIQPKRYVTEPQKNRRNLGGAVNVTRGKESIDLKGSLTNEDTQEQENASGKVYMPEYKISENREEAPTRIRSEKGSWWDNYQKPSDALRVANLTASPRGMRMGQLLTYEHGLEAKDRKKQYVIAMNVSDARGPFYEPLGFIDYNGSRPWKFLDEQRATLEDYIRNNPEAEDIGRAALILQDIKNEMRDSAMIIETKTLISKSKEQAEAIWEE